MILTKKSFYITSLLVMAVDQFTKNLAISHLQAPITVCDYLNLLIVKNFGVSFGILNFGVPIVTTRILIAAFVTAIIAFLLKIEQKSLPISLIIGGALGNLFDRIYLGYVIDFIDVHVMEYHWPAFNIADCAVCIGVFLYVLPTKSGSKRGKNAIK